MSRVPVENTQVVGFEPLRPPREAKAELPATERVTELVLVTRRSIRGAIRGEDQRQLVIVGPCSVHDPEAAIEYAERLGEARRRLGDRLILVMRTYFEKPRTTVGWKGLVNDPHLDGSCDIQAGLLLARKTLLRVNELGVPAGSELLDPVTPQYIADLLSWASIGARTTESQTHREMASGVSMPVGFKNGTDGSLDAAVNALISAGHAQSFLGVDAEGRSAVVKTSGNPDRHVVLRGGGRPNYFSDDVRIAAERVQAVDRALRRPIMIDTSHGNSEKDFTRQGEVCRAVLEQVRAGQSAVLGFLIESNLFPGRQDWKQGQPLQRGVSITDGCIGWDETRVLLEEIADAVASSG
jgi:3-deoxy-7-phosphoheptulonate synthase